MAVFSPQCVVQGRLSCVCVRACVLRDVTPICLRLCVRIKKIVSLVLISCVGWRFILKLQPWSGFFIFHCESDCNRNFISTFLCSKNESASLWSQHYCLQFHGCYTTSLLIRKTLIYSNSLFPSLHNSLFLLKVIASYSHLCRIQRKKCMPALMKWHRISHLTTEMILDVDYKTPEGAQ